MKLFINSRLTGLVILCHLLSASAELSAQDTLPEMPVLAEKSRLSAPGKKTEAVDSLYREQFMATHLGELLGTASGMFVKSYGPGLSVTTAMRGGNASQTAVLWNGLSIQNPMLAQSDLSNLPVLFFEQAEVEYGGSSAMWGSGAIGGSVRIGSLPPVNKGLRVKLMSSAGSFGRKQVGALLGFSEKRFTSATKVFATRSQNNYSFYRNGAESNLLDTMEHAAVIFKGLMQDLAFAISEKQKLQASFWLQENQRQIPAYIGQTESRAGQFDRSARFNLNWMLDRNRYRSIIRAGYFNDRIAYSDSLQFSATNNIAKTLIAESEHNLRWGGVQELQLAVNITRTDAESESYVSSKSTQKASLLLANKFYVLEGRVKMSLAARVEHYSASRTPFTWNAGIDYRLIGKLFLLANGARVFRQPGLNELYWLPGGNPALKPEQGYSFEGGARWSATRSNVELKVSACAYSRVINDWILWVPGRAGNPSPQNLQQVWSRGAETTWDLRRKWAKRYAGLTARSVYVISTVEKDINENADVLGRQLIYTPRYQTNAQLIAGGELIQVVLAHQYVGYRFTSTDNRSWLEPYQLLNARINFLYSWKNFSYTAGFGCNNILNKQVYALAGRPLPLRNYEISIVINYQKSKNKTP